MERSIGSDGLFDLHSRIVGEGSPERERNANRHFLHRVTDAGTHDAILRPVLEGAVGDAGLSVATGMILPCQTLIFATGVRAPTLDFES